jgi:hypothetical protein
MRKTIAALVLMTLAACGDPTPGGVAGKPTDRDKPADVRTEIDPDQKVRGYGFVYDPGDNGPGRLELCFGSVNDTTPPRCGGPRLVGWDWDGLTVEGSHGSARWGRYQLTGYYDGKTFRAVDAEDPPKFEGTEETVFDTPCEEPNGGWRVDDPERATEADRQAAIRYAESQPEHAATWVDYLDEPTEYTDPKDMILNIAFTEGSDVEAHEAELRELWDGPLCVIARAEHSQRELSAIQNSNWEKDYGLEGRWSDLDVINGTVLLGVMYIEDETRAAIAERYGEGTVVIFPALEPVE